MDAKLKADPVTIKRLRETVAVLKQKGGINTLEDFRLAVGKDLATGIAVVSSKTGASQWLLVALLITEAADDAGKRGKPKLLPYWCSLRTFRAVFTLSLAEIRDLRSAEKRPPWSEFRAPLSTVFRQSIARPKRLFSNWKRHWFDALVLLLPVVLLLSAWRANSINKNTPQYVTTAAAVPAFHRFPTEADKKNAPEATGPLTNTADANDRYALNAISAGATVQGKQLLSAELSAKMQGRKILAVPIKAGTYSSTLAPPVEAIMVFSPREQDLKTQPATSFEVIVLSIESHGEGKSAIVALREDSFQLAASLLGSHDVFLSQPVP